MVSAAEAAAANAAYLAAKASGIPISIAPAAQTYLPAPSYASLGSMPLSQISALYGPNVASAVSQYYMDNPSPNFVAQQTAYNQQHYATVGGLSTTYNPQYSVTTPIQGNSAAAIAAEVARVGGTINPFVASTALREGYQGPITIPTYNGAIDLGMSTVPVRELSSVGSAPLFVPASGTGLGETVTTFVPYGDYTQTRLENTKLGMGYQTGELGIYQPVYSPTGELRGYGLIGGGGRAALQSGMFTVNAPQTPFVTSQEGAGTFTLPSGAGLSRLGAEAYGGFVQPLDTRTIQSTGAQLSTYANLNNLANYVSATGVNLSKTEAPGANIPWSIGASSPAIQYMDEKGLTGASPNVPILSENLTGSGRVAASIGGAPVPPTPLDTDTLAKMHAAFPIESQSGTTFRNDPFAVALEGAAYLGDSLTFGMWKPGSEQLTRLGQNVNPTLDTFNVNMESVKAGMPAQNALGMQIKTDQAALDAMTVGKLDAEGKFTGTPTEYAKYQALYTKVSGEISQYNMFNEKAQGALSSGFASGAIIPTGDGGYAVNPDNAREYGAFSDWSKGAGQWIQKNIFGQTPVTAAQFSAYEQSQEFKNANPVMQFGEGAYKTIATNPASLAGSFIQGVEIYAGFGLVNAGLGAMAGTAPGAIGTIGRAGQTVLNSPVTQYGLGAALIAGTIIDASKWGTLPVSQTMSNLGGASTHLVAMGWGGYAPELAAAGSRMLAVDVTRNIASSGNAYVSQIPSGNGPRGPLGEGGGATGRSSFSGFRNTVEDTLFSIRQRAAGIENIGVGGGTRGYEPMPSGPEPRPSSPWAGSAVGEPVATYRVSEPTMRPELMAGTERVVTPRPFYEIPISEFSRYGGVKLDQGMAVEYVKGRYPGQENLWEMYMSRTQMAPREFMQPEMQRAPEATFGEPRPTQYAERTELNILTQAELKTLDLRESIDLTSMGRPENVATPAEQAMVIRQYDLTSQEIKLAKQQGLSLNDILQLRELQAPMSAEIPVLDLTMARPLQLQRTEIPVELTMEGRMEAGIGWWETPVMRVEQIPAADYSRVFVISPEIAPVSKGALDYSREIYLGTFVTPSSKTSPAQDYSRMFDVTSLTKPATAVLIATVPALDYSRPFATTPAVSTKQIPQYDYARPFDLTQPEDYSRPFDFPPDVPPPGRGGGGGTPPPDIIPPWVPPPIIPITGLPKGGGIGGGGGNFGSKVDRWFKFENRYNVGIGVGDAKILGLNMFAGVARKAPKKQSYKNPVTSKRKK